MLKELAQVHQCAYRGLIGVGDSGAGGLGNWGTGKLGNWGLEGKERPTPYTQIRPEVNQGRQADKPPAQALAI